MTMRFCPKCDSEVEASGGYCLLGHSLALTPPVSSITELRDEVDKAFQEATLEVAVGAGSAGPASASASAPVARSAAVAAPQAASGAVEAPVRPRRVGPPPPPPPRRPAAVVSAPVKVSAPVSMPVSAPVSAHVSAPASAPVSGPGEVPTPEQIVAAKANVWKELGDEIDLASDPISTFAPPPTMDWGPRESKLRRKPNRSLKRFKRSKDETDQT
jgi:hypothetical protein